MPKADSQRQALAATIGADGRRRLAAVDATTEQPALREVKDSASAGELIAPPYAPEAHWSTKRQVQRVGYTVHLTETCDPDAPQPITQVATTPATTRDDRLLPTIHTALAAHDLLPNEHLVDAGYTTAGGRVTSRREHTMTVVGPVALDPR